VFEQNVQSGRREIELVENARRLTEERDELKRQLDVVHASKSWMLTAPMRRIALAARSRRQAGSPTAATAPEPNPDPDLPPPALRARVAGTDDARWFRQSGAMALEDITAALARVDRSLAQFTSIYDFGCGCGRITLPLTDVISPARVTATDSDAEATAWLSTRLPSSRIQANRALPPLPFADDTFDLIIGWSIFTHLPEDYQDAWLAELARVLSPGGMMLQTVHGPTHFDLTGSPADDPIRNTLPDRGFIYFENYGSDSPFPQYYQTTFHHPDYIRERWSRWFDVLDILPGAARPTHDMVLSTRGDA
jgi:SAM-dependent methyltransferase